MDYNSMENSTKESITTKELGEDEQPHYTNLHLMDKETQKETTQTNKIPPKQSTTQANDKEMSKGQANRDTQVQGGSKAQSTSRIQEYTISTATWMQWRRTHSI